jgi:nucleotide-binding universal stress UspA family protein
MKAFQPKRILCPTDFSEPATLALHYANEIAVCFDATLMVLYADFFIPPPYFTSGQMAEMVKEISISRQAAREHLTAYVRRGIGEGTRVETILVESPPMAAIMETAATKNADLIVMGSHGRSGFNRMTLGSVTERVLHEVDRPLLTVRVKEGGPEPERISINRILCPVNLTAVAHLALAHAVAIAECFRADLQVVHVIERAIDEEEEKKEVDRLCTWVPPDVRSRCGVKEFIEKGEAAERILAAAAVQSCDLIVLGAQHKRFVDTTVIGMTTTRVTRHASCPVLVVVRK